VCCQLFPASISLAITAAFSTKSEKRSRAAPYLPFSGRLGPPGELLPEQLLAEAFPGEGGPGLRFAQAVAGQRWAAASLQCSRLHTSFSQAV